MQSKEKSISQEIESSIRRRVFAAFAILILLVIVVSAYEIFGSVEKLAKKLEAESRSLSNAVVSEILVANEGSIQSRLDAVRDTNPHIQKVAWKNTSSIPQKSGLSWHFPLSFTYIYPVSYSDIGRFGYLEFFGNIAQDKTFLNPVMLRFTLIAIFAMFVISVLMPLSHSIPEKFVREPIHNLVKLFQNQLPVESSQELITYTEIRPAVEDLKHYLANKQKIDEAREHIQKTEAIADAVQMLAHDVRRPFSMLLAGIRQIEKAQDPQKMAQVIRKVASLTKDATKNVDRLVAGVMDLQSNNRPQTHNLELVDIIRKSLVEVFGSKTEGNSSFVYQFEHTTLVNVEEPKVERVFANLIENAFEAQKGNGKIWFSSCQQQNSVQLEIGNDGSYINRENLDRIFDRFFTSGKANGTGLGLAIAKKVIEDHGGSICCESSPEVGTIFRLTLPASSMPRKIFDPQLPPHCAAVRESMFANRITAAISSSKKVALIEDDDIFVDGWRLSQPTVEFVHYEKPEDFIAAMSDNKNFIRGFDAVITDFRFHQSSLNGDDVARFINDHHFDLPVILSSHSTKGEWSEHLYRHVIDKDAPHTLLI